MPFFLVTQTSLIEAQDEHEAAQIGVDRLRSGAQVTVSVKSDESTITHVVVPAIEKTSPPLSVSEVVHPSPSSIATNDAPSGEPLNRKLILKRIMSDALALLGRRT